MEDNKAQRTGEKERKSRGGTETERHTQRDRERERDAHILRKRVQGGRTRERVIDRRTRHAKGTA